MPRRRRGTAVDNYKETNAPSGWCTSVGKEQHKKCPIVTGTNTCSCKCHKEKKK